MDLLDIVIAKQLAGGGGGSGTDNYNDLSNLPKINDTTLSGNKSSSALGLQSEINSDSKLASDLVDDTNQGNKFVTSTEKNTWNAKQNAIDADHKINADYVDDSTSTNKFVTSTEKNTWNAKQNAIDSDHKLSSDLVDDANHTNKFVTSTEKQTWNAKQNAIDSDHKLSSSLVSFTTAEAAALASGIDSSKVGQISTNQTNILYAINTGAKNLLAYDIDQLKVTNTLGSWSGNTYTYNGVTYVLNDDATVTVTAGNTHAYSYLILCNQNYDMGNRKRFLDNSPLYLTGGISNDVTVSVYSPTGGSGSTTSTGNTDTSMAYTNTANNYNVSIGVAENKSADATIKPMLRSQSVSDSTYQPFALPNYDLTRLESEDRASLAEVVDSGAKNKLQYDLTSLKAKNTDGTWNNNAYTIAGITYTLNSDMSISISGTRTTAGAIFNLADYTAVSGDMMSQGTVGTYNVFFYARGGSSSCNGVGNSLIASTDVGANRTYAIAVTAEGSAINQRYYPMICTKAAFGVSSKFVPYRLPYDDVQSKTTLLMNNMGGLTFTGNDLNALVAGGRYLVNNASDNPVSNAPYNSWQTVEVFQSDYSTYPKVYYQIATDVTGATVTSKWRRRTYSSGGQYNAWTAWSS